MGERDNYQSNKLDRYTPIPEGCMEKMLRVVRNVFYDETTGMESEVLWEQIENKAGDCKWSLQKIAKNYEMRNIGHIKLSKLMLNRFLAYKQSLPNLSKEEQKDLLDRLSWRVLDYYPRTYRDKYEKEIKGKITYPKNEDSNDGVKF